MISSLPGNYENILAKTFAFTSAISKDSNYNFFTYWYNTEVMKAIAYIPLIIIVSAFALFQKLKSLSLFLFGTLLLCLFLAKGNGEPFGFVYEFLFKYFPLFYIFKSPVEKFGLLYIYVISLSLLFLFMGSTSVKFKKFFII